ncbi:MAG: histidine phosphatase family protein [Candidatus Omnitrophica bacterium]|nr:histidine phosphatase family protein [Candidatus Omnitrophota bacterium]
MTTKLILIRHGITKWNKEGRYCGYKDVSLSSQGKLEVIKLRKSLSKINFDRIYCSDRKRALATRAILFGRSDFTRVKGLREINFGVFEGLKHDEIVKKYPEIYKKWLIDPYKGRIPNAESMQVFKKRVKGAINKILCLNRGKTIAVVCHGGVIGIFVSCILKSGDFWSYVPSAASVTIVECRNNRFKINKFNDKTHLVKV